MLKEVENATINGHLGFALEKNSVGKITWLSCLHGFQKVRFKMSSKYEKPVFTNSSGLKNVFEKLR